MTCPACRMVAAVTPTGEQVTVQDLAFEMAHDDVLTAWRVRNAALAVAAAFVHPGPDHADMTARQALVREWVSDGHDQVEEENHQRTQMLRRMVRAEQALRDVMSVTDDEVLDDADARSGAYALAQAALGDIEAARSGRSES